VSASGDDPGVGPWKPLLAGANADEAVRVAREVGMRLRETERLESAIRYRAGVAESHPAFAIAFAQLDACLPGEGWDDAALEEIESSAAALRGASRVPTGLFAGLAGTAYGADFVDPERYAQLLRTLDGLIARRLEPLLARLVARRDGCAEYEIDVVSGLAGIGAYALSRGDEPMLRPVVERLVGLLGAEGDTPAWRTPPELLDDDVRDEYPDGRLNCGLAHGIPGPLALLCLVHSAGFHAQGLEEAIRHTSGWLVEHAIEDERGVDWPYSVPGDRPARAAWCYGAPGIARALRLAGEALGDPELQAFAVSALESVFLRPREELRLDGVTFCHGVAGVLQITMRMAADSDGDRLREAASGLAGELIERFEPDAPFGYRGLDPDGQPEDQPGLLEGAAGVALVLLAAATSEPPRWDRVFLLA